MSFFENEFFRGEYFNSDFHEEQFYEQPYFDGMVGHYVIIDDGKNLSVSGETITDTIPVVTTNKELLNEPKPKPKPKRKTATKSKK